VVDPDFKAYTRREDGALIVEIQGELDLATVRELGPLLEQAASAQEPVVVDLCGCGFIGSIGLASLIRLRIRMSKQHRSLMIACLPKTAPARLFELAANGVFELFGSRREALDHLQRRLV
jgi:anti-anti-sigma factor